MGGICQLWQVDAEGSDFLAKISPGSAMDVARSSLGTYRGTGWDMGEDGSGGVVRLTYAELAARLGIKPASARKLAQRRRWARAMGNDGLARVVVPMEEAGPEAVTGAVTEDRAGDVTEDKGEDMAARVAALEATVGGLREVLEVERRRADAAEARAQEVARDRDAWREQATRSLWSRLFGQEPWRS